MHSNDMFEAVLCDMDGTLVDTEIAYDKARKEVCRQHLGFEPTDEEGLALIGVDERTSLRRILEPRTIEADLEAIIREIHRIYNALLQTHLHVNQDAPAFLQRIAALGAKRALVTGSTRDQAEIVLGQICTPGFFAAVVTADDVANKKPHPEPYLNAAQLLGVDPSRCISVEDSNTGVRSAVSAGTRCFAVQRYQHIRIENAHVLVQDLSEIPLEILLGKSA